MQTLLIVIHIIIAIFLVATILLQRTSSDGLQGLGSSAGMGVMSPATSTNFMIKLTVILATIFIVNCLVLANLATTQSKGSILDKITKAQKTDSIKTSKELPIAE